MEPTNAHCPACGAVPGDPCETATGRATTTHAARRRYATAMDIDARLGRTAARRYLPTY